ncbi:unnamed protein product, partial [Ectocarpus sp. 12 AP-2014]
ARNLPGDHLPCFYTHIGMPFTRTSLRPSADATLTDLYRALVRCLKPAVLQLFLCRNVNCCLAAPFVKTSKWYLMDTQNRVQEPDDRNNNIFSRAQGTKLKQYL